ncbi:MAG TPA: SDR family oxidoreductase [Chthoniobacter sp.]|jgi:NAD(P)-dependent dehydrogenase (short-subunit alcohol dehydrogenase family)
MTPAFLDAVVVTGAGRGLGRAVALMAGRLGIPVLCIGRSNNIEETRAEIAMHGGHAEALMVDLTEVNSVLGQVGAWIASKPFRRLAVVLAAGTLGAPGGLLDGDLDDWSRTFQANVIGNLAVVKALLPAMRAAGFGRVVTVAGGGAAYAYPVFSGYALSKTALVRATENLDAELRGQGDILTVCLAPGAMETRLLDAVRATGAEVRTVVPIAETVEFIREFIHAEACGFSGRFVHVRDNWRAWLGKKSAPDGLWLLRRNE